MGEASVVLRAYGHEKRTYGHEKSEKQTLIQEHHEQQQSNPNTFALRTVSLARY
jgi:hypothetical protein